MSMFRLWNGFKLFAYFSGVVDEILWRKTSFKLRSKCKPGGEATNTSSDHSRNHTCAPCCKSIHRTRLYANVLCASHWISFFKVDHPRPIFVYFRLFEQTLIFLQQINVHPVNDATIRTHNLRNITTRPCNVRVVVEAQFVERLLSTTEVWKQEDPSACSFVKNICLQ